MNATELPTAWPMKLTREARVEWFRYESANHRAALEYERRRDYLNTTKSCPFCGEITFALSGFHTKCKNTQPGEPS